MGTRLGIGACRAVWVPGQDLATPHLMHNCGKRILSLHVLYAIRTSVRAQAHICYIDVFVPGPRDMSMHDSK